MAGIKDGMSNTGDAPDVEMKEGPGPSARDPDRIAPAPPQGGGQEELKKTHDSLCFQFRLCAEAERNAEQCAVTA